MNIELAVILPCEHLVHDKCLINYNECKICNSKIVNKLTYSNIKNELNINPNNNLYKQIKIDMDANILNDFKFNFFIFFKRIFKLVKVFYLIFRVKSIEDITNTIKYIINVLNIKINIIGEDKIKDVKTIISTHKSELDSFILGSIFYDNIFISSLNIKQFFLFKQIDLSIINNDSENKMKLYSEHNKNIILYPENIVSGKNSLYRFNSDFSNLDKSIHPIIIKYYQNLNNNNYIYYFLNLISQHEINVDVIILDKEDPPFNFNKIENIRQKMAFVGNFNLSRCYYKNIIEK